MHDHVQGGDVTEERDWLAVRFEQERAHLRAVSYRMLGSVTEAEDAVQEAWLRLCRADSGEIENLSGWLTTVVARVCLNLLQARRARREEPAGVHVPDPVVSSHTTSDPEQEALLADSVGLALLVVLDALTPAERLAFVLHDMFAVPYEEIGLLVGRSAVTARQLASRARRRVQGQAPVADSDLSRQREIVDAFLQATRDGDFAKLLELLDPDVVLRADQGPARRSRLIRGARAVAEQALSFSQIAHFSRPAVVNGNAGLVTAPAGKLSAVGSFTIRGGRIVEMNLLADPERLVQLDISLDD
jgi:RNA polymerase sigma-70 factor, ECF subfamily